MVGHREESGGLTRYLSPLHVWALAFGCAVGWGAFMMPGTTFLPAAGPWGTALGMLAGAVAMLVISVNYHVMMNRMPESGGPLAYTKRWLGYDHGFICAWFIGLAYMAILWANATALALFSRRLLGGSLQWGFHYRVLDYDIYGGEMAASLLALAATGWCAVHWKKLAAHIQAVFALALAVGVLLIAVGVLGGTGWKFSALVPPFAPGEAPALEVFQIAALAPWAFLGFESVAHSVEEFRFSPRSSLPVMALSVVLGLLAYVLLTWVAVAALPHEFEDWTGYIKNLDIIGGLRGAPVFYAVHKNMGETGMLLLGITVFAAILTGIIGNYIAASRLMYSMAKDRLLPEWFGVLTKDGVPKNAILFIFFISIPILMAGRTALGWIVDVTTVGAAIAYGYTSATAFIEARKEGRILVQVSGALGCIFSLMFCLFLLLPHFWEISALAAESYLILAVWSILGLVVFRLLFRRHEERLLGKSTVAWVTLLFLIFFSSLMWERQSAHRVIESIVHDMGGHYAREMQEWGIERSRDQRAADKAYLREKMGEIRGSLLSSNLMHMGLLCVSLVLMFSIYAATHEREQKMEMEKLKAEHDSRAKTVFLSNMSHDLRTPMNAIIGYINLAKREPNDIGKVKEYLEKIGVASHHLLALINDVLEMSRIESGKMELEDTDTDLVGLLGEVDDMFATQMEAKGVRFTVDTSEVRHRHVRCDKNRLNRVLLNLVSNAFKFTPEGGSISIRLSEKGEITDGAADYELRVKDSGIGMSEEFARTVFESFTRERNQTVSGIQGTGLGMAITKNIVDLMHGTIDVLTEQGKGTEFVVNLRFSLQENPPEDTGEDVGSSEAMDFSGLKILLVDDLDVNREIATMILAEEGFEVRTAENGKEALDILAAASPGDFDIVLMDVRMPVMNGYEATKEIRRLPTREIATLPILAMTANALREDVQEALDAGMDGHIAKPIDVQKMFETLAEVLRKRRMSRPEDVSRDVI